MARIKIKDLPKDMKISKEEMKNVLGGALYTSLKIDGVYPVSIGGGGGGTPTESYVDPTLSTDLESCLAGGDKTPYLAGGDKTPYLAGGDKTPY